MANTKNELLADRLGEILTLLNQGETLSISQLAEKFKTHKRTIERDFIRLRYLNLIEENGSYTLDPSQLGKLDLQDIKVFAAIAGVSELFPSLDDNTVRRILDSHVNAAYASKGYFFEDATALQPILRLLETAINAKNSISFTYKDTLRQVEPYKLVHHHNCWYLAAVHDDALKTYRISWIQDIHIHTDKPAFQVDPQVVQIVDTEENIWFSTTKEKEEVILKVDPQVASQFRSRKLLPEQEVVKNLDNGGLLISSRITNSLQIVPLVRYWIPHLHVVSPESLRIELEDGLRTYLG